MGRVAAIHDFGAGAILEIEGGTLWPASSIAAVDLSAGKLVLEQRDEIVVAASKAGSARR